jgi:hypothetical protein
VLCGGEDFEMHASVVTCGSANFRAMLEHAMVDHRSRSFEMHLVRPRVLERVVEWLYSGELAEISDAAEGLAVLAESRFLGWSGWRRSASRGCARTSRRRTALGGVDGVWLGCAAVTGRAMNVAGRRLASVAKDAELSGGAARATYS